MPSPKVPITAKALYGYQPSLLVAVVGAVIFICVAAYTCFQYARYRTWFLYMLILGVLLEISSQISRLVSITHPSHIWAFLVAYLIPIVAPSFIAAACYMTFSRIVWYVTPNDKRKLRTLWLPALWISPLLVLLNMGAFFVQFIGVAEAALAYTEKKSSATAQKTDIDNAIHVLKFGIIVQLACCGLFALIGSRFMFISRRWTVPDINPRPTWRRLAWSVNAAATLIMLRGIYRVFEFSAFESKSHTYVVTHEWLYWMCDVLPMLAVFTLFIAIHPGAALPGSFTRWRLNEDALGRNVQPYDSHSYSISTRGKQSAIIKR